MVREAIILALPSGINDNEMLTLTVKSTVSLPSFQPRLPTVLTNKGHFISSRDIDQLQSILPAKLLWRPISARPIMNCKSA